MNQTRPCPWCGEPHREIRATCEWQMQNQVEEANMLSGLLLEDQS